MFSAIIGLNPSNGARSPLIWNRLYSHFNRDVKMIPLDCSSVAAFESLILDLFSNRDFNGGAIAAPYKAIASKVMAKKNERSYQIPINCIYKDENGLWDGLNTDAEAAYAEICSVCDLNDDVNLLFLGCGGTGFPVLQLLSERMTTGSRICLTSRSGVPSSLTDDERISFVKWDERYSIGGEFDLVINTTSLGDKNNEGQNPFDVNLLASSLTVHAAYDIVYDFENTLFLDQFKTSRKKNGRGMNLLQALVAFSMCNPDITLESVREASMDVLI